MLAERIRQEPRGAGSTLVMLTSGGQPGEAARCRELGIASYLMKPIKQSDLLRAITAALRLTSQGEPLAAPAAAPPAGSGRRLRVLLAEDNLVNQRLAVRLLEKAGHTAVVVGNGKEALAALERQPFDLVLMDWEMPEMGGLEATAAIREREKKVGEHVPIIAMTAHALKGDRERCLAAGMDGYVPKPIQAQELRQVIAAVVPPEAPSAAAAPAAAPVLDASATLERVGGDRELLAELYHLFTEQCPVWLAEIRDAISRADADRLRRAAHTLKGAVGNFGAQAAHEAAQRLETMGRDGDLADAAATCAELERQLQRLMPALAAVAAEEASTRRPEGGR
jgi:CheY-like chemotaxis protein